MASQYANTRADTAAATRTTFLNNEFVFIHRQDSPTPTHESSEFFGPIQGS